MWFCSWIRRYVLAYLLMTLLILFLTGPMMAGGIWLATLKDGTRLKALGVLIALIGVIPTLLWTLFTVWDLS